MIILTAANSDLAKDDTGKFYSNFSFKGVINKTTKMAEKCGYRSVVYDLGSLGIGEKFIVSDETFMTKGYYEKEVRKGYKSKSLFKPEMVKKCILENNELTVYLDGDAQLCDSIDEIKSVDYDIGVTLRDPCELQGEWYHDHFEIVKYVNAGVIFFNPTPATEKFVNEWLAKTEEVGNDQKALNILTCPDEYPETNSIIVKNGVRIKFFPGRQYNFYYFDYGLEDNIKIMHFKGDVRHYYPFNIRKKLFCKTIVPIKNFLRARLKNVHSSQ